MILKGKSEVNGKESVPMPLFRPQNCVDCVGPKFVLCAKAVNLRLHQWRDLL